MAQHTTAYQRGGKESRQPALYLAPLRGVTDALYRALTAKHFAGFDLAVAPFVTTVAGTRVKPSHLKDLFPERNRAMPVIPQLLSKSAREFRVAASALSDMGYTQVNWNLGCPYAMVARKGRGSGMLPYPDRVDAFLDDVMGNMPLKLSVKTRLGRFHRREIDRLIPIFNRYPLTEVIIHPRTGVQMYEGSADLDAFEACAGQCVHPVVYNGDIVDYEGFRQRQLRFGNIRRWMIGRGAIADPFLAERICSGGKKVDDETDRFRRFHTDLYQSYGERLFGPRHLLDRMKGLWAYYARSFLEGKVVLKRIRKAKTPASFEAVVDAFLDGQPAWRR